MNSLVPEKCQMRSPYPSHLPFLEKRKGIRKGQRPNLTHSSVTFLFGKNQPLRNGCWLMNCLQPIRKGIHPKVNETQGFQYLGHQNWTIFSLLSWFCPKIVPPSWSLYWGVQFLITPEGGLKMRKRLDQKWMRHWGFSTWGIQTGPFSAC